MHNVAHSKRSILAAVANNKRQQHHGKAAARSARGVPIPGEAAKHVFFALALAAVLAVLVA